MSLDANPFAYGGQFLLDAIVLLFLVAAIAKLLGLRTFRFGLQLLPFMTAPIAAVVSVALPVAELLLAVFLFLNHTWAKYVAVVMLVLFSSIAILAVSMGRQVPCGCFSQLDGQTLSWRTVFRNGLLILIVLIVLSLERRVAWMFSLWPTALVLLFGLSLVRLYRNRQLILELRRAKAL